MAESPLLHGLNDRQRAAVTAPDGPHLIMAGPGSGKTRVLTHRVAFLLHEMGVSPYRIMAVTFTNKAAREMTHRIGTMRGGTDTSGLSVGTFHALCARIMRVEADHTPYTRDYVIFDTRNQLDAVKAASLELNIDIKQWRPRSILNAISAQKNELVRPEVYADRVDTYFDEIASRVYIRYQQILQEANAVDFDDLLMQTVEMFRLYSDIAEKYQRRYRYVLVDEFQDTNFAQYKLVQALAAPDNNIFAVGDPDQSIYAFRGADYRNITRFEGDFPDHKKIMLEQNYRSTQNILDAAMAVINHNPNRIPKHLFTDRGEGEPIMLYEAYDEDDEGQFIVGTIAELNDNALFNPGDCAIMYRTNAQSRSLEESFRRAGMPYRLIGATRFYDRREIRDLMAYLRAVQNPNDSVSMDRVINTPPRGIGNKTLQGLHAWSDQMGVSVGTALMLLHNGGAEPVGLANWAVSPPGNYIEPPFNARARKALENFAAMLVGWRAMADADKPPLQILDAIIDDIHFNGYVNDGTPEAQDRWDNVLELREGAAEFNAQTLTNYLTEVALVSDVDSLDDTVAAPSLLTLHSAKGLEFPVVFIAGLEEGTLPHMRSMEAEATGDKEALPEERRLMYVGLTRAMDRLYLSYAFRRSRFGDTEPKLPSRFLHDLPEELLADSPLAKSSRAAQDSYARMTNWADDIPSMKTQQHRPTPPPKARFSAGMRVRNPHFGEGIVIASKAFSDTEEVDVQFDDVGRKRMDGSFLEPIG